MFIKHIIGRIKGEKRKERVKIEIEELKKVLLEDPQFRDEILRELEYRTGRRDLLKAGVLGLLGLAAGGVGSAASSAVASTTPAAGSNTAIETISDYTGVKIPKPCTCIVAQDGTGDYDVSPGEDASEVIQGAIDYAAGKGGGEVRIREGEYNVLSRTIIKSNSMIKGTGARTVLNLRTNNYIFETTGTYGQANDIVIENLKFNGNGNNGGALNAIWAIRMQIKSCSFHNFKKEALKFKSTQILTIERCLFDRCGNKNIPTIYFAGSTRKETCTDVLVQHCTFELDEYASIYAGIISPLNVNSCYFEGRGDLKKPQSFITVDNGGSNVQVTNSLFFDCGGTHISIDDAFRFIINGNILRCGLGNGISANVFGIISGNSINEVNGTGILLNGGGLILGNTVRNCGDNGIEANYFENIIIGNRCRFNTNAGIKLNRGWNIVIGNLCSNNKIGIQDNATDATIIENNYLFGNTKAAINRINRNPSFIVRHNLGVLSENQGSATITAGNTLVVVNHGLFSRPTKVIVTPRGNIGSVWVSNVTPTQFTINCSISPDSDTQVDWYAEI